MCKKGGARFGFASAIYIRHGNAGSDGVTGILRNMWFIGDERFDKLANTLDALD